MIKALRGFLFCPIAIVLSLLLYLHFIIDSPSLCCSNPIRSSSCYQCWQKCRGLLPACHPSLISLLLASGRWVLLIDVYTLSPSVFSHHSGIASYSGIAYARCKFSLCQEPGWYICKTLEWRQTSLLNIMVFFRKACYRKVGNFFSGILSLFKLENTATPVPFSSSLTSTSWVTGFCEVSTNEYLCI